MQANEITRLFQVRPFESFKLRMADGSSVTVRDPDQALVTVRRIFIGLPAKRSGRSIATPPTYDLAEDWIMFDPIHIVAVEPDGHRRPRSKPRR